MSDFGDIHEDIIGIVQEDIRAGFDPAFGGDASVFNPVDQFHKGPEDADVGPIDNERCAVVIWTYDGVHSNAFQGIEATNAPVTIEGCSVVSQDADGNLVYRRYVNWVGLLGQMGVTFTRPVQYDASEAG
jgi:hypothetical protein